MLPNGNNVKDVFFNSDGLLKQDNKDLEWISMFNFIKEKNNTNN